MTETDKELEEHQRAWLQSRHTERMREVAADKIKKALDALERACHSSTDPNVRVVKARLDAARALQTFLEEGKL